MTSSSVRYSGKNASSAFKSAVTGQSTKNKRPSPLSIRMSPEHRARLEHDAAGMPLNRYVCKRLFEDERPARQDKAALAQILAMLGKIGAASNLADLAEGVRLGTLPVTPEVEAEILTACADLQKIKSLLMAALRIKES